MIGLRNRVDRNRIDKVNRVENTLVVGFHNNKASCRTDPTVIFVSFSSVLGNIEDK